MFSDNELLNIVNLLLINFRIWKLGGQGYEQKMDEFVEHSFIRYGEPFCWLTKFDRNISVYTDRDFRKYLSQSTE